MSTIMLAAISVVLVVMGFALGGVGVTSMRQSARSAQAGLRATVLSHQPVDVEMVTDSRGTRRTVSLVDIKLRLQTDGRTVSIRRAPELARQSFAEGTEHVVWPEDDGGAALEPPTMTHGLALVGGGFALLCAAVALWLLRSRWAA